MNALLIGEDARGLKEGIPDCAELRLGLGQGPGTGPLDDAMTMRTCYALDAADKLVDIADLSRDTRHLLGPYRCSACKSPVIPALGERVSHYFRHRRDRECHGETYLHKTAKLAFLEAFTAAVAAARPYPVQRPRSVVCRRHEGEFGLT